jgi:hypothetical protein
MDEYIARLQKSGVRIREGALEELTDWLDWYGYELIKTWQPEPGKKAMVYGFFIHPYDSLPRWAVELVPKK